MTSTTLTNSRRRATGGLLVAICAVFLILSTASPAQAATVTGWIDSVSTDNDSIAVRGWAADPDVPDQAAGVHIYLNGKYKTGGAASLHRPDVNKTTGLGSNHGFQFDIPTAVGRYTICVYAIDKTGDPNRLLGCRDVTVGNPPPPPSSGKSPVGWVDSVKGGDDSITVRGWAADPDVPDKAAGIHIYVDGKYATGGSATTSRPDVNKATGLGSNHGFQFQFKASSGVRRVCVYAIDKTGDPNKLLRCLSVLVGNEPASGHSPIGRLEAATKASGGLRIKGWALDPDTTKPIGIHVYVNGKYHTGFVADLPRADVDRAHNRGARHGFNRVLAIGSGWHTVCVHAIDRTGDKNTLIQCKTIILNLQSNRPIERVSRFTTYFDCCQNRVTNIRVMARAVDKSVVLPGQTFSIDQLVGPRTTAKGYLPAPYLVNGQGACCAIGGGVSQFGTTIHNAVFWGGYQIDRHQPHTGWISRYPLGIEATLVYSSIDYKFTNDTDTPVIIRTSSTGTSVTVELWGNQGGWQVSGYHPRGARNSSISVLDNGGSSAKRVKGTVYGSAPGTVRIVRTLTQNGVSRSQTWWWTYVS